MDTLDSDTPSTEETEAVLAEYQRRRAAIMRDNEVQDYIERHTIVGASERLTRTLYTVAAPVFDAVAWILDRLAAILGRLV